MWISNLRLLFLTIWRQIGMRPTPFTIRPFIKFLDLADIRSGVHVLDVACGTGVLFPYYLSRNVASITGVDLSADMISQARKNFNNLKFI